MSWRCNEIILTSPIVEQSGTHTIFIVKDIASHSYLNYWYGWDVITIVLKNNTCPCL